MATIHTLVNTQLQVNYCQMPGVVNYFNAANNWESNVDRAPSIVTSEAESEDDVLLEQSSQHGRPWLNDFDHPEHHVRIC